MTNFFVVALSDVIIIQYKGVGILVMLVLAAVLSPFLGALGPCVCVVQNTVDVKGH